MLFKSSSIPTSSPVSTKKRWSLVLTNGINQVGTSMYSPCSNESYVHDLDKQTLYRYVDAGANDDNPEVWVKIDSAPNLLVSNMGNIFSIEGERYLKKYKRKDGYESVHINRNPELVHRVVLSAFLGFNEKNREANHISGVKDDNRLVNLEWTNASENQKHKYKYLNPKLNIKPIQQYKDGIYVKTFQSIIEASRELNIPYHSIFDVLNGRRKTCHGFVFKRI